MARPKLVPHCDDVYRDILTLGVNGLEKASRVHDKNFAVFFWVFINREEKGGKRVHCPIQEPRRHPAVLGKQVKCYIFFWVKERHSPASEFLKHPSLEGQPFFLQPFAVFGRQT